MLPGPSGRSASLLRPPDIGAVLFGGRDDKAREAQESTQSEEAAILTITLFPASLVEDQNLRVCANVTRAKQNTEGAMLFPVARSDSLFVLGDFSFLLDMVDPHILGLLT